MNMRMTLPDIPKCDQQRENVGFIASGKRHACNQQDLRMRKAQGAPRIVPGKCRCLARDRRGGNQSMLESHFATGFLPFPAEKAKKSVANACGWKHDHIGSL